MAGQSKLTSDSVAVAYKGMNGGLNNTACPLTLQPNESSKLLNIDFDKFGSAQKRSGIVNLNTVALNSGAQITGMHWYEKRDGSKYLVVVAGNKIYSNQLTSTFTDITGSVTITPGYLCKFVTFLDTVVITNGYDAPFQWTGTGNCTIMTIPTDITRPRLSEQYQSYLFFADSYNAGIRQGSRLNWSVINSISSWLDTDFAYISWNDGTDITAIKTLGDRICIFKNRSIWIGLFTGDVDVPFQFQKTQSHVGCVSGYSPFLADNGLIFLGEDGLYFFDGNQSEKLSNRLNETFYNNNTTKNNLCCSMYQKYKNRFWLSQFTGSNDEADQIVTFDTFNNAFGIYDGIHASAMCIIYNQGQELPYFGDYRGFIYRADIGTDDYVATDLGLYDDSTLDGNGNLVDGLLLYDDDDLSFTDTQIVTTAIDAYWYTRWLDYDDLTNQKAISQLDMYYKLNAATLTVTYSFDFEDSDQFAQFIDTGGNTTSRWGTMVWGSGKWSGSGGSHRRVDLTGRGRTIRIGVKNANVGESFRFDGIGQLVHLETNQ